MSNSLCRNSVPRIYQEVIDDVLNSVREVFKEEGVDDLVLQELKQTWEAKVKATKAVHNEQEEKLKKHTEVSTVNGFPKQVIAQPMHQQGMANQHQVTQVVEAKLVPIQITLPPQPGTETQRALTIHVPSSALIGNQLQRVLTGPVITATMGLPANIATSLLQQHVNAAFGSQQSQSVTVCKSFPTLVQTDGQVDQSKHCESTAIHGILSSPSCSLEEDVIMNDSEENPQERRHSGLEIILTLPSTSSRSCKKPKKHIKSSKAHKDQVDGPLDSSDEDDEPSDDNEDEDDDLDEEKDEDNDMEDDAGEEEPLNSEDDVSEEDPGDLFETDNIVVCQYDKIIRNRNKWKFYLKDGIMNLSGQDYVFQKANGDAEW